jgi:hypothetical protein
MKNRFYQQAERIGQLAAEQLGSSRLPLTPDEVIECAQQFQLKITIISMWSKEADSCNRAIYDHLQRSIIIQEASLHSLQVKCEKAGFGPVGQKDILAMHIAHELFHHLEEIGLVLMSSYFQYNSQRSKFYTSFERFFKCPSLGSLREVAAHSFVTTLLGLSVSPSWLEKDG